MSDNLIVHANGLGTSLKLTCGRLGLFVEKLSLKGSDRKVYVELTFSSHTTKDVLALNARQNSQAETGAYPSTKKLDLSFEVCQVTYKLIGCWVTELKTDEITGVSQAVLYADQWSTA